jgi:hypothetical protein
MTPLKEKDLILLSDLTSKMSTPTTTTTTKIITTTEVQTTLSIIASTLSRESSSTTTIKNTMPSASTDVAEVILAKCRITIDLKDYVVTENELLHLDCPKESRILGENVYKCTTSGEFLLVNSTCIQTKSKHDHSDWLENLENDVIKKNKIIQLKIHNGNFIFH